MARTNWAGLFAAGIVFASVANGLKVPFQRRNPRGARISRPRVGSRHSFSSSDKEAIDNMGDIRYTTNITINGVEVTVALDTGSTDLWVSPPGGIGEFNDTTIPLSLLYGDGSYGVEGTIGVSPFTYGAYQVEQQAFLNGQTSTIESLEELGVHGVLGLSFDIGTASPINDKIKSIYGEDATWGRSVLQNIFLQHPDQHDFVALDLGRTNDLEDTDGGSFFIGETDDKWAAVLESPKIPQHPVGADRWTVLLEGIFVDNETVPLQSSISGVPAGSAQALLDTGDPTAILPLAVADGIYSKIPGARKYTSDTSGAVWLVPCNTTSIVELVFAGTRYPLHPLDLTQLSDPIPVGDQLYTACVAAFHGVDNWSSDFDVSLGDSFLRNVYAVFDFGNDPATNTKGNPYIQLLSQIDIEKAKTEVDTIRSKTLVDKPPVLTPDQMIDLLNPGTTTTTDDDSGTDEGGNKLAKGSSSVRVNGSGVTVTLSDEAIKRWGIIGLCLLGGNLLIGIALLALAIVACVRRGSSRRSGTIAPSVPHYVPVPMQNKEVPYDDGTYSGYNPNARYSTQ